MIKLQDLTKRFKQVVAVNQLNLIVEEGEIFGLVGPDGAGKTTLIRLLTGLLRPDQGQLLVLGQSDPERVKGELGYVPQRFSLYGDLTVMENLEIIGALYGASCQLVQHKAREILGFTNLLPFKDRLADQLSGGMKQKLALAAGLMHRPKLFFLDEPTTGVDPVSRREFWYLLYELNKAGMTIFVSTPYMDEAELCTKLAFMHEGKVVAYGRPEELKRKFPYQLLELKAQGKQIRKLLATCGLIDINAFGDRFHLIVQETDETEAKVKQALQSGGILDFEINPISPSLEDVFVQLASEVM